MADDPDMIAATARITGRVQGVWFRGWVRQEARQRGLTGWVRNEADGSVRALFVGQARAVAAMVALCHDGPPHARVDRVEATPVVPAPELRKFSVAR